MTVSLANGNSQVVFYSSSTQVMKPTIVPASDLVAGTRVMIGGTSNSRGVSRHNRSRFRREAVSGRRAMLREPGNSGAHERPVSNIGR